MSKLLQEKIAAFKKIIQNDAKLKDETNFYKIGVTKISGLANQWANMDEAAKTKYMTHPRKTQLNDGLQYIMDSIPIVKKTNDELANALQTIFNEAVKTFKSFISEKILSSQPTQTALAIDNKHTANQKNPPLHPTLQGKITEWKQKLVEIKTQKEKEYNEIFETEARHEKGEYTAWEKITRGTENLATSIDRRVSEHQYKENRRGKVTALTAITAALENLTAGKITITDKLGEKTSKPYGVKEFATALHYELASKPKETIKSKIISLTKTKVYPTLEAIQKELYELYPNLKKEVQQSIAAKAIGKQTIDMISLLKAEAALKEKNDLKKISADTSPEIKTSIDSTQQKASSARNTYTQLMGTGPLHNSNTPLAHPTQSPIPTTVALGTKSPNLGEFVKHDAETARVSKTNVSDSKNSNLQKDIENIKFNIGFLDPSIKTKVSGLLNVITLDSKDPNKLQIPADSKQKYLDIVRDVLTATAEMKNNDTKQALQNVAQAVLAGNINIQKVAANDEPAPSSAPTPRPK